MTFVFSLVHCKLHAHYPCRTQGLWGFAWCLLPQDSSRARPDFAPRSIQLCRQRNMTIAHSHSIDGTRDGREDSSTKNSLVLT